MDRISAADLLDRIEDPRLRIADVRWYLLDEAGGRRAYEAGHLPHAIFVDVPTVLAARMGEGPGRHPLPDPARFADRLGRLGIGDEHLVVAYDDAGGSIAARLWWMLEDLGHRVVTVLDGGIEAWRAAGGTLTTAVPRFAPAELHLADRWTRTIDRVALRDRLDRLVLLDARAGERYRGETEPADPVAGHIPTARSLPYAELLDATGRLLPPAQLGERLGAEGADGGRPVVVACGSGINATLLALAMRVAGLPDPILYEGSYSDWSRSGWPVATGPGPGEAPGGAA